MSHAASRFTPSGQGRASFRIVTAARLFERHGK